MPYIDTDDGGFVNADYIVLFRRDSRMKRHSVDDSRGRYYWDLTAIMADGTQHKITGERAADVLKILSLPVDAAARQEMETGMRAEPVAPGELAEASANAAEANRQAGVRYEEWIATAATLPIFPPDDSNQQPCAEPPCMPDDSDQLFAEPSDAEEDEL